MDKVETKPFREAHVDLFEPAADCAEQFNKAVPFLVELGKPGQCGIHMLRGRILYVGGWYDIAPGVAELFIYPSIYAVPHAKSFFSHARWWVNYLKSNYRRLQCWGEDTDVSKRWLARLGFTQEGTLKNFAGEGIDMLIWGKV